MSAIRFTAALAATQAAAATALAASEKFIATLADTQAAAATAIMGAEKFTAALADTQANAAAAIAGLEKFAGLLSLTASANAAVIYASGPVVFAPGFAAANDAMQGGLLALNDDSAGDLSLADTSLYSVQITESV